MSNPSVASAELGQVFHKDHLLFFEESQKWLYTIPETGNSGSRSHGTQSVHIITQKKLKEFWARHTDAEEALTVWHQVARKAVWNSFGDVQRVVGTARSVAGNRIVFKIKGNRYRLVVKMEYGKKRIYIRFIGTHAEYDRIDAEMV